MLVTASPSRRRPGRGSSGDAASNCRFLGVASSSPCFPHGSSLSERGGKHVVVPRHGRRLRWHGLPRRPRPRPLRRRPRRPTTTADPRPHRSPGPDRDPLPARAARRPRLAARPRPATARPRSLARPAPGRPRQPVRAENPVTVSEQHVPGGRPRHHRPDESQHDRLLWPSDSST
jgi:hypothetical protein